MIARERPHQPVAQLDQMIEQRHPALLRARPPVGVGHRLALGLRRLGGTRPFLAGARRFGRREPARARPCRAPAAPRPVRRVPPAPPSPRRPAVRGEARPRPRAAEPGRPGPACDRESRARRAVWGRFARARRCRVVGHAHDLVASWSRLMSVTFFSSWRTSSSSASRIICSKLRWNSRDIVRALRTQYPATRNAAGKSLGPITTSATTPISTSSGQPISRNIRLHLVLAARPSGRCRTDIARLRKRRR